MAEKVPWSPVRCPPHPVERVRSADQTVPLPRVGPGAEGGSSVAANGWGGVRGRQPVLGQRTHQAGLGLGLNCGPRLNPDALLEGRTPCAYTSALTPRTQEIAVAVGLIAPVSTVGKTITNRVGQQADELVTAELILSTAPCGGHLCSETPCRSPGGQDDPGFRGRGGLLKGRKMYP